MGNAYDALFINDIKDKKRHLLSLNKEKENIINNGFQSTEKIKSFSDCYESSDIDSATSFGSERDRRREMTREAARTKWNDGQILRFADLHPELHQNEDNVILKEKVINLSPSYYKSTKIFNLRLRCRATVWF